MLAAMRHAPLAYLAIALCLASSAHAESSAPLRVLVTEVNGPERMDEDALSALSRLVESEVRRAAPDLHVVTVKALNASLEVAAAKACLGTEDASCMADLAGAFGVDYVVTSYLGQVGSQRVFTLSVFRSADALVLAQASRRVPADDEGALLDAAGPLVREVLAPTGTRLAPAARTAPLPPAQAAAPEPSALPTALLVGGVVAGGLAIVGGAAAHAVGIFAYQVPYDDGRLDREAAGRWEKDAPLWLGAPFAAYVAGAALIAGGVAAGVMLE